MSQGPIADPIAHGPRDHPSLAVVVIVRRGGVVLQNAAQTLAAAARAFGIDVLVLLPTPIGGSPSTAQLAINIREIAVDPADPESAWRASALAMTSADIIEFVEDEAVAGIAWDDRLPFRLGLLRNDLDRPGELRQALERSGVPVPAAPRAQTVVDGSLGSSPILSVIVAVSQGERALHASLEAIRASDLPRGLWELVVVDDGSLDGSAGIAAGQTDVLVRLPGPPHGPAYARNRGVEASLGDILVFVDADVCLHLDALRRIALAFATAADLGAVFGSYDADPPAPNDISQYRNLRHHFVHHREAGAAETFWAALGAMRRGVFARAGRFDEWHFPKPQIEDIELGYRVRGLGYSILLDPAIEGTHLKRWTLKSVVRADLENRGIPWIRLQLALRSMHRPATLLFRRSEWVYSALVCVAFLLLLLSLRLANSAIASLAALLLVVVLVGNRDLYRFFARHRGPGFALRVIPIHFLYYLANAAAAFWAWILYHVMGTPAPPAEIQAYSELNLKTWPPLPAKAEGTSWEGGRRQSQP